MAIHKGSDQYAAAGHYINETGAGLKHMKDCPECKYGTLLPDEKGNIRCIDCGKLVEDTKQTKEKVA